MDVCVHWQAFRNCILYYIYCNLCVKKMAYQLLGWAQNCHPWRPRATTQRHSPPASYTARRNKYIQVQLFIRAWAKQDSHCKWAEENTWSKRRTRGAKGEHVEQEENTWNKRRTCGTKLCGGNEFVNWNAAQGRVFEWCLTRNRVFLTLLTLDFHFVLLPVISHDIAWGIFLRNHPLLCKISPITWRRYLRSLWNCPIGRAILLDWE